MITDQQLFTKSKEKDGKFWARWRNRERCFLSGHECGTKKNFWVPVRSRTSDLRILRSECRIRGKIEEQLPKISVRWLLADSRPTVGRQSADEWPTDGWHSADSWLTVAQQSAVSFPNRHEKLSADCLLTVGKLSVTWWFSLGSLSVYHLTSIYPILPKW